MKNTLNPCKCGTGTSSGDASDIVYDGLSLDCLPGLVGQNLATAIKRLGDAVCETEGHAISVTVNPGVPSGGGNGDIWLRQQGNVLSVYQNVSGSWIPKGDIIVFGDLQQVTDEGNTTDNAIQVSGTDNADTGVDSAVVRYTGTDAILSALIGGSEKAAVSLGSDSAVVSAGASQVRLALSGTLGARFLGASSALITVKGADAVDDNEFVTKRQLDSVAPTRTPDPSLSFSTTSSDMDTAHPTAAIGDIFYNVDGPSIYVATKIATGIWQIQQSGT